MTYLSSTEIAQIDVSFAPNLIVSNIAQRVKRHKLTVSQYLQRRKEAKQRQLCQRVAKLTNRDNRRITQIATTGRESAKDVKHELSLSVSERRTQQVLRECPYTAFLKLQKVPHFWSHHKAARSDWAELQLDRNWADRWRVVFSDEKKFKLDGPDGLSAYLVWITTGTWNLFTRQQGVKLLMVRGAILIKGVFSLVGIDETLDAR